MGSLIVVHVHAQVLPTAVEAFRAACVDNARESVKEPGIARFDILQQVDDPAHFILVEIYRSADAPAAHKETAHYKRWRDTVAPMMVSPRASTKFANVFPDDEGF